MTLCSGFVLQQRDGGASYKAHRHLGLRPIWVGGYPSIIDCLDKRLRLNSRYIQIKHCRETVYIPYFP